MIDQREPLPAESEPSEILTSAESVAFLLEKKVKQITLRDIQPGKPFLFVIPEHLRDRHEGQYKATVARIENPTGVVLSKKADKPEHSEYQLFVEGRVGYFEINRTDGKAHEVAHAMRTKGQSYKIREGYFFFEVNDELFPPNGN